MSDELLGDVRVLEEMLDTILRQQEGAQALDLVNRLRGMARSLRAGTLDGGRDAFAAELGRLDLDSLELVSRVFTQSFHLVNTAEEQQRIRTLRRRDLEKDPPEGSIAGACAQLRKQGVSAEELQPLLQRLFVMPVLTAHPTEARRRTVIDHLAEVSLALDRVDDPRPGHRERDRLTQALAEAILALYCTEESRADRPTPVDEVRATISVFDRTLLDVTPAIYRELEDCLHIHYPEARIELGPFLRWGSWVGGDRDGNPHVDAEVTRQTFERHRALALSRYRADVTALGRALSVSARRSHAGAAALAELEASLEEDRRRLPDVAARVQRRAAEPWREKLWYMRARLEAAEVRGDARYLSAQAYLDDLKLLERTLLACGLHSLARGRLRDAVRRAEVFGFHLATLDIRQHSAVHEAAVAELLARGGLASAYRDLDEPARLKLLQNLLTRADLAAPGDRQSLSRETREVLSTLEVVGWQRRDLGPEAAERYVVSFTSEGSDLLEVLFLARAARLAPDEIRPVPLLEQLQDLEHAETIIGGVIDNPAMRAALRGELEVMIGYSDSGKQVGYLPSTVALARAQETLASLADRHGVVLTIFHGRGGAVGRGGGPANRAIRAQPARALRGRLRMTEQGETIAARYGRPEIARRDLEQIVSAVLLASLSPRSVAMSEVEEGAAWLSLEHASHAAHKAYGTLLADRDRLARYAVAATPIEEVAQLRIASRPAGRKAGSPSRFAGLTFEDLRAIPWVFSWNQSRHGLPGWFGLGSALESLAATEGSARAPELYRRWPFFRALIDNAQLALVRADIDVAEHYARLADPDARSLFDLMKAEHTRTLAGVKEAAGHPALLGGSPAIASAVARRNPYVDVLSHAQITLLRRLAEAPESGDGDEQERIRAALAVTINGIAAGLQTAG